MGTIVEGEPYTRGETYASGIVTLPLQQVDTVDRLAAMNRALVDYSETLRKRSARPEDFVPLRNLPGNAADPADTSVCWTPTPSP